MNARKKLSKWKDPYDLKGSEPIFLKAIQENVQFHYNHCEDYKRILDEKNFSPLDLKTMDDLAILPFIPTLYLKHHAMFSLPERKMFIKATSSGTSGNKSKMGFDISTLLCMLSMTLKMTRYHRILSMRPCRYILMGYQPNKKNSTAISKTTYGFTYLAPALKRTYALPYRNKEYKLDMEGLKKAFIDNSKKKVPVRTAGFPAYIYFLLEEMKNDGTFLKLPKGSKITVGGGWKQFYTQQVDKKEFYALIKEVLGVDEKDCVEFFGAVEHPILYCDCDHHHFHVPVYSRIIIRDPDTLQPVENGKIGLINLITPLVKSVPVVSIMTDDLGILHDESECNCGIHSPYLEIIGRVGIQDIVTCAAGASEFLKNL